MSKIKILVVEPNKEPYPLKIECTLENLQNIVGGQIEVVALEENIDLICNDKGKLLNLEMNRAIKNDIICGTFIISGQYKGEIVSLNDKQIEKYTEIFKLKNEMGE